MSSSSLLPWLVALGTLVGCVDQRICDAPEIPYDGVDNDCDASTLDDDLDHDGLALAKDYDDGDPDRTTRGPVSISELAIRSNADALLACACASTLEVRGDVTIEGGNDVSGLQCLTAIDGRLDIDGTETLTNLDGLGSLTSIGGDLTISYNDGLATIEGLDTLESVGGDVWIRYNRALSSLAGFGALRTVGGDLNLGGR